MDEVDRSAAAEEFDRAAALARALGARPRGEQQRDTQGIIVCLDCGEPIPAARLRVLPNAVRCVECQAEHDGEA